MKDFSHLINLPGTPQEQAWIRERLETLSVKEGVTLAAAMEEKPPDTAADAVNRFCALPDYKICGFAGDYKQLGDYAAGEALLPKEARPYLDLEKLGRTYAEAHPGIFCEGHYVEFPAQAPELRYDPKTGQLPEDINWSIKLRASTPAIPEGVWIRLPDHQSDMDSNPDEIALALNALGAKTVQELTLLDSRCVLPGTWNLLEQYQDIADLMYDGDELGFSMEYHLQNSENFKEQFWAAVNYEACYDLRYALNIAQNLKCYDWVPNDGLEKVAEKELRDCNVPEETIRSGAIDLTAYGKDILTRSGYSQTPDESGYIFRSSQAPACDFISPQPPAMGM